MSHFDVFNGDADGICALHQLRMAAPCDSMLVTGLKREISLLERVAAGKGDAVTVLDISLDRNRAALEAMLGRGAQVSYYDHHYAGVVPRHPGLRAYLDDSPVMCTSAIVNRELGGRFAVWAAVGAFGDALDAAGMEIVRTLSLAHERVASLRELGISINYAAYGHSEADVVVHPAELYRIVSGYADPFELIAHEPIVERLARERVADFECALATPPIHNSRAGDIWVLPDAPWARRVSGTFANRLAGMEPERAHAVLTSLSSEYFMVSVRAPQGRGARAMDFCRGFDGGGRAGAGGIDRLDAARLEELVAAFEAAWPA